MRKPLLILVALITFGGLGGIGWQASRSTARAQAPDLIEAQRGALHRMVLASGVIEAASLISVGAQVGGQIQSLPVALGDVLQPGDLVAQIDPEEQQTDLLRSEAALAQIEAQILALKADLAASESALLRKRQLTQKGLTAAQELEPAEAQMEITRANLKSAEAERAQAELSVQSARIALQRTRITAPSGGTVVALVLREGQTINASQSSPTVIKLADLTTMVIKTEISEADVIHVRPGQKAAFTLSGAPELRFEAVLRAVEPAPSSIATADEVDTGSAIYYNALLDVPNPNGLLRIGMSAEVRIELAAAENVLILPRSAIDTDAEGHAVVQVWDATRAAAVTQRIEIGLVTAQQAEITSGLKEGMRVIAHPDAAAIPRSHSPASLF